ncbi:MAG: type VI secretion system baseplate subunit TssG [Nitrospiria bacterium]
MADTGRTAPHCLTLLEALERSPGSFDFFQAIRRLEGIYPEKSKVGHASHAAEDLLRLAQEPSLAFAPGTLSSFVPGKDRRPPRLSVLFFGLFGPNGPLPLHLSEYARERMRNAHDPTFTRFADIFHHRMLSLFYRAWAAAQPAVNFDRPEADRFSIFLSSLFGLGMPSLRKRSGMSDLPFMHYAGRFVCQTRNAEGLKAILSDFFQIPVAIEEFIGQWITLPKQYRCQLGGRYDSNCLGGTATIGSQVWVCQQKFRIVMGPMDYSPFRRLLPGGESLKRLTALVRHYVGDELEWDVRLILKKEEVPGIKLGERGQVGWTSWLNPKNLEADAEHLILNPLNTCVNV